MDSKEKNIWGIVIQTLVAILTAIGTECSRAVKQLNFIQSGWSVPDGCG